VSPGGEGPCPLCGRPLFGWIKLPPLNGDASVGLPSGGHPDERVIDRCENCGVAVERDRAVDLQAEWEAICRPANGGGREIAIPNRASLQAAIGVEGWAAVDHSPGRLLLTPRSLELLAEANGERLERVRWPLWGRSQGWMWQTLLNGLTFHPNFAREAWAGRLRPANSRGRFHFAADALASLLAAPLVALVSVPLELIASLARRGGEIAARAGRG
jgi:hypothetical protein